MEVPGGTDARSPRATTIVHSRWAQTLLLALLCVGSFAAGIPGGFVSDDKFAILGHQAVQGTAPLLEVFTRSFWGDPLSALPPSYRPIATLSFAIDHRLFGGSALAFHLSSLLWYLALVLLGWTFARRCMPPLAAWLAMALFAVMPTHAENVASLVGRADTMGVLFAVLALLAVSPTVVDGQATSLRRVLLAMLAFATGLLCKESIAVLPVVVGLGAEARRRSGAPPPASRFRLHAPTAGLFLVLALYLAFRLEIQPGTFSYTAPTDVVAGAGFFETAAYTIELVARYARLIAVPVGLCTGRTFAEVSRPTGVSATLLAGVGLAALAVYVSWKSYRRGDFPFVAAAVLAWAEIAGVLFAIPESMADRFLIFPSFFLCLALGQWLSAVWRRAVWARVLVLAALGTQVVLSSLQAATWHDDGRLLAHAVRACPSSIHNHFRYAEYLSQNGQVDEAVWHYAVFTSGRHAFPNAWSHPAAKEERTVPIDQRLRDMHRLLRFSLDERTWRGRFVAYLRSLGRRREAQLMSGISSGEP